MFPIFDPYLVTRCKLMNLFPQGEWHSFLYKLSYLTNYLTAPSAVKSHPLLPEANLLTSVLLWKEVSHIQFHMESSHGTMGSSWVWVEPSEASPPRSSQSLWSSWSLFNVWLFHSTIWELWAYMQCAVSTWCLKFCLLVVLNQLHKPGHCLNQCWLEVQIWELFP